MSETAPRPHDLQHLEGVAALGYLLNAIAHDLNNVLQLVVSRAELLAHTADDSTSSANADALCKAAMAASAMTRSLLDVARLGQRDDAISLDDVVREAMQLLPTVLGPHVELCERVTDQGLAVRAGRAVVLQVIVTLALNARDAMPEGGTITLEAQRVEGHVCITVRDTGRGMDLATRQHAFEPFFTTKETGSGLGLAVASEVVKEHGGHIEVDSAIGKGSSFHVFLPSV